MVGSRLMKASLLFLVAVAACASTGPKDDGTQLRGSAASSSTGGSAPASSAPSSSATAANSRYVKAPEYEGVVFTSWERLPSGEGSIGRDKIEGAWAVDDNAVARAEAALAPALEKVEPARDVVPKLAKYKRQYFGFIVGGKRRVYVNAFCIAPPTWREQVVAVDDGGSCYFQAIFDMDAGAYVDIRVNGVA